MCPACLSAVALLTVGATSAGGLAVYGTMKLTSRKKPQSPSKDEGESHE